MYKVITVTFKGHAGSGKHHGATFPDELNELLADNWQIVKTETITPPGATTFALVMFTLNNPNAKE